MLSTIAARRSSNPRRYPVSKENSIPRSSMRSTRRTAQPCLDRTQLGVIELPGRLLPVAGSKGHARSAVEQRDGGSNLLIMLQKSV
jgi:hypothetical protein